MTRMMTVVDLETGQVSQVEDTTPLPSAEEILADRRASASMSRTEFALRAARQGKITMIEAADWAAKKSIPAIVQAMVDSLPEDQRGEVYFDLMTADIIRRNAEIMPAIGQVFQMTEAQIDAFFGIDVS